jgi:hypothetical protein
MTRRRLAVVLWVAWAIVAWNVAFDQVLVFAGREAVGAALAAARTGGPYIHIDDWTRPALARALWIATATAAVILVTGLSAIRFAGRIPGASGPAPLSPEHR